jgi:DNA-directed RNA polymerase specialized sigma24 family protein
MSSAIKTRLLGSQSDEKLLELARDRSQSAWQTLVRRHHGLLLRHCRQLCLSEETAQEVVRRALSTAWSGIEAGAQPRELQPWLHGIADRIAVEELHMAGSWPAGESSALSPGAPAPQNGTIVDGAPTPDELLALRGALRAMTPDRSREGIIVHRGNGNKAKVVAEDAFELADSAVRGLLGRARRGISALTPPPLLAWAMGRAAEGGASGERMAELGAGGGAAGLAGLALKGGLAAFTAGVAITGAVIAQSKGTHALHAHHQAAATQTTAVAASTPAPAPADAGVAVQHASGRQAHSGFHNFKTDGLETGQTSSQSSTTAQSTVTPTSTGSLPHASGPPEQSAISDSQSTTSTAGASASGASGSAPTSTQSSPTQSGSESAGHGTGVGVQISVGSGSGQQTPAGSGAKGSTESTSSSSETSSGIGVGVSVSLEPLGSVGVHVSLP